jgi:hypothetical protein
MTCTEIDAAIAAKSLLTPGLQAALIVKQATELVAQAALTTAMTALSNASSERMIAEGDLALNLSEIDMLKSFRTSMGCT